jgi:hypothetical protein
LGFLDTDIKRDPKTTPTPAPAPTSEIVANPAPISLQHSKRMSILNQTRDEIRCKNTKYLKVNTYKIMKIKSPLTGIEPVYPA